MDIYQLKNRYITVSLDDIQNNYNPTKAYSSVYSDGTNRYLVEGHHTTVAFKMLGKDNAINMNKCKRPEMKNKKAIYEELKKECTTPFDTFS